MVVHNKDSNCLSAHCTGFTGASNGIIAWSLKPLSPRSNNASAAAMRKQKSATATTRSVNDDLRSRLGPYRVLQTHLTTTIDGPRILLPYCVVSRRRPLCLKLLRQLSDFVLTAASNLNDRRVH